MKDDLGEKNFLGAKWLQLKISSREQTGTRPGFFLARARMREAAYCREHSHLVKNYENRQSKEDAGRLTKGRRRQDPREDIAVENLGSN